MCTISIVKMPKWVQGQNIYFIIIFMTYINVYFTFILKIILLSECSSLCSVAIDISSVSEEAMLLFLSLSA